MTPSQQRSLAEKLSAEAQAKAKLENGGPAFPTEQMAPGHISKILQGGMTLRDYFAAAALQGMLANAGKTPSRVPGSTSEYRSPAHYAEAAWATADEMIKARKTP